MNDAFKEWQASVGEKRQDVARIGPITVSGADRTAARWVLRSVFAAMLALLMWGQVTTNGRLAAMEHELKDKELEIVMLKIALKEAGISPDPKPWKPAGYP